jgi:hypothetical protein
MSARPTVVPLTSLADAASIGVDLALQERASVSSSSDPTMMPDPGTMGIAQPPPQDPSYA